MRLLHRLVSFRPLRFVISGGAAAVVNLAVLFVLVHFAQVWYLVAAAIAYGTAIYVSFMLQKFFTFGDYGRERIARQSALFVGVQLLNLGVNTLLMYAAVDLLDIHYLLAQILSGAVIAVYTFAAFRYLIFKPVADLPSR